MEETRALVSALRLLAAADPWRGHMPVPRPRPRDIIYFAGHVWRAGRPPLDAGIHRLPYSFCWRRSSNPLPDCVFIEVHCQLGFGSGYLCLLRGDIFKRSCTG